jgi:D-3-phosphoglycerate dehydrogenase / 2-oxoglutarate reductase
VKRKVLFIDRTPPVLAERLSEAGYECDFQFGTPREELEPILGDYFGIVIRSRFSLDEAFLSRATGLVFIGRSGVGLEHIDLDYAAEHNIAVFTTPEGSRDTVGEHALGLLLGLMNNLSRADREVRQGKWIREGNRGTEIKGKTIGILGYGNMGSAFAGKLQGLEARVIAYDKYKKDYGDGHAEEVSIDTLFEQSDVLSVHIPYMPENHYFIDGAFLDRFRKPVYVVNTARGLVLNTADLVARLQNGKVPGAALDVLEYEETSFAHLDPDQLPAPFQYLRQADNVVLTPHIAGWSHESKVREAEVLAEKIVRAFGVWAST